jgi:two-component system cell cycle response regulator CpdR
LVANPWGNPGRTAQQTVRPPVAGGMLIWLPAIGFMNATADIKRPQRLRIILLEDSHILSEILRLCIMSWFWDAEVVAFENGDDAWEELSRLEPDLLITDRVHPGMDGEELVWKLAAQQARFPILFLSGDIVFPADASPNLKVVCLPKPFDRDSLWRALNELVGPCNFPAHPKELAETLLPASKN